MQNTDQNTRNGDKTAKKDHNNQDKLSGKPMLVQPKVGVITKVALGAALGFSLFCIGVGVGDGRLSFKAPGSSSTSKSLPATLDYSSVNQVYTTLRKEYDGNLDQAKLVDGMKEGLAKAAGDPYTEYFTPTKAKEFSDQLNGTGFSGIGAELGQDSDKNLIVVSPIAGTPAANAGLKAQDVIAEIDGKSTNGLSIDEAVTKIRGKKGTKVSLKIVRNKADAIDLDIVRDDIKIPSVQTKVLDNNVGYMRITTFGEDTGDVAAQEAQSLKDKQIKSLVLDLRGNPGGAVDSAIKVASLWVPKGKLIMQEKRGSDVLQTYTANGNDIFAGLPTVVLMDGGSASASEIVAGALHDTNSAKLLGEKSYGKGVVQAIEPLGDNGSNGQLKVTVARWYRPNGQNIDKKGIDPDQKVTVDEEALKAGKDNQLEAAQAALNR